MLVSNDLTIEDLEVLDPATEITTEQAAIIMQRDPSHVRRLIRDEKLDARTEGQGRHAVHHITIGAARAYRDGEHKRGWPKGRTRNP